MLRKILTSIVAIAIFVNITSGYVKCYDWMFVNEGFVVNQSKARHKPKK